MSLLQIECVTQVHNSPAPIATFKFGWSLDFGLSCNSALSWDFGWSSVSHFINWDVKIVSRSE